jgi:CheY-like chemotaxis protein
MNMDTAAPLPPIAILVVDDNPADVYFIRRVLDAHGLTYDLQVLENRSHTRRFFEQLAQQEPGRCPDILLLDLYLPGLDSAELLQSIKAMPVCAHLRVVIMTGSDDPSARLEAHTLGADAFFQKPLSFQAYMELGHIIKSLVLGTTPEASES